MTGKADELRPRFRGELLGPVDEGYDRARAIWNGSIDRRPALIARCTGAADVMAAVGFAGQHGVLASIRAGGHNVSGSAVCDGGIMIDLSAMKGIRVDPRSRTVRAEPGLLWGEFDRETQAFGLATPGGIITQTGIAGLTVGGGIGWLMRKHGLTCDNLTGADVVTAEGELLEAGTETEPDLLWALQGGGGNFGIVTSFRYRLHSVGPSVLAGPLVFAAEEAGEVLRFYRDWIDGAPEDLGTIINMRIAPPAPWLPPEVHGRKVLMVAVCYAGSVEDGERVVEPLRRFGRPLADGIAAKPYVENQGFYDATVPHGWGYYWKSHYLDRLTDQLIDVLMERAWEMERRQSYALIFHMGGRIRDLRDSDMAFSGRDALHAININGVSVDPREDADRDWVRGFFDAVTPHATGGVYVNFLGNEGEERVRAAYGEEKLARLIELKNRYDPGNFFRLNQNIPLNV
jgi:FAD/FMN-containing dehydrogenase